MHSMRERPVLALVSFVIVVVVDVFKQMACASSYLKVKAISEYLIMEIYTEFCFTKIACTLHRRFPTWSESLRWGAVVEGRLFAQHVCPL